MNFPILTYHRILRRGGHNPSESDFGRYSVFTDTFTRQIQACQTSGRTSATLRECLEAGASGKHFILTFDDGTSDAYEIVVPLLEALGVSAVFFVTVSNLDKPGFLSVRQLGEIAKFGHEIASHGMNHRLLTKSTDNELREELHQSLVLLSDLVGDRVVSFATPYGIYDKRIAAAAKEAGYRFLRTAIWGTNHVFRPLKLESLIMRESFSPSIVTRMVERRFFPINYIKQPLQRILGGSGYAAVRGMVSREKLHLKSPINSGGYPEPYPAPGTVSRGIESFLVDFFSELAENGIRYCVLRNYQKLPTEVENDVDILVDRAQLSRTLVALTTAASHTGFLLLRKVHHANLSLYFYRPGEITTQIHIDLFTSISWYGFEFMAPDCVLSSRRPYKNFFIPNAVDESVIKLFTRLLYGRIPKPEYKSDFLALVRSVEHGERIRNLLVDTFGRKVTDILIDRRRSEDWNGDRRLVMRLRFRVLVRNLTRSPLLFGRSIFVLVVRYIERIARPAGVTVAVIGPDGAGKSTLITSLRRALAPTFAEKQYVVHWRPPLRNFSGDKTKPPTTNPHSQEARSVFVSFFFFLYHWFHFVWGSWTQIYWKRVRGYCVWLDRYYLDFFVDQKRYRLNLPQWVYRLGFRFVHRPDILLCADGNPETLLARKPELPRDILERYRKEYMNLAQRFSPSLVIDTGAPVDQCTTKAADFILVSIMKKHNDGTRG